MNRNDIVLRLIELQAQAGRLLSEGKLHSIEYKVTNLEIQTLRNQLTQWDREAGQNQIHHLKRNGQ